MIQVDSLVDPLGMVLRHKNVKCPNCEAKKIVHLHVCSEACVKMLEVYVAYKGAAHDGA